MTVPDALDHCWSRIGVGGDGSCPELARVIHCRNCAVYAHAGRSLFEQPAPAGYLDHCAAQLARPDEEEDADTLSTVVFRLAAERLALPTATFVEAVEVRPIHRVPHRSGEVLLGVANIRGELQLCVSLAALLAIAATAETPHGLPRLAVIEVDGEHWAFPVDEMLGVHRVAQHALLPVPPTTEPDASALVAAQFALDGEPVALLDAGLVVARLRRAIA